MVYRSDRQVDFLLVGQGLAGTLLAYELIQAGKSVIVIDRGHQKAASKVAAGIINPITGRYFAKSWMIDHLFPHARQLYRQLESLLSISCFEEKSMFRILRNPREHNDWQLKSIKPKVQHYLGEDKDIGDFKGIIDSGLGFCQFKAAQLNMPLLVRTFRDWLHNKKALIEAPFDYSQLKIKPHQLQYQHITAQQLVCCEGQAGRFNPFFGDLPFRVTKGEVLYCEIKGLATKHMIKHNLILAPLPNGQYWLGSNYERDPIHAQPTESTRAKLLTQLEEMMKVNFSIKDQRAAIRPTIKDRRPLLGTHPKYTNIHIFNGLGTKGASLGPYWAKAMLNYLLDETTIPEEVNIQRFEQANRVVIQKSNREQK